MSERKSPQQIIDEGGGCEELIRAGYFWIRLYKEGEERCKCEFCMKCAEFSEKWSKFTPIIRKGDS